MNLPGIFKFIVNIDNIFYLTEGKAWKIIMFTKCLILIIFIYI